jgi:hypothetical protein
MIRRIDRDLAALDLAALERVRCSALRTLAEVEPHLDRLNSDRTDLQAFKLEGLLFYAVELVEGVLVDPALPVGFDATDHLRRGEVQRARWWGRPYIERTAWDGPHGLEAYERAGQAALLWFSPDRAAPDVDALIAALREHWFCTWPDGIRYEVRCLDGAAGDRATSWGVFASMAEALDCAVNRWRQ